MTNGELVSRVINDSRAYTKDGHISKRHVLRIARNKSAFYLAQKLGQKSLDRDTSLVTCIPCFEMEKVSTVSCGIVSFRKCGSLMKSKNKLPDLISTKFGQSVISVISLDGSVEFDPLVNASDYKRNKSRPNASFIADKSYYYLKEGYLYLPDSTTEVVEPCVITTNPEEIAEISGCEDCEQNCESVWDMEFIATDSILEPVISETINEIVGIMKRIPEDENPNLDSNIISQTTR